MEILQNRAVAIILCAVMILGAVLAGVGSSLHNLRAQSEAVFELGGMQRDLEEIAGQCYNITVIARRYLPEDAPDIVMALQKRSALLEAVTPGEKYRAAGELLEAITTLCHTLDELNLSEQDLTLLKKCTVNIDSSLAIMAGNSYNESAASFNRALESFPANILAPLIGAAPLELYK